MAKKAKAPMTLSEKNKRFWAKTPEQQRVAVAKDVIKQINAKFLIPEAGLYTQFSLPSNVDEITNLPDKIDNMLCKVKSEGATCEVCGIGSIFISQAMLGNDLSTASVINSDDDKRRNRIEDYSSFDITKMRRHLRKVFPSRQLTMIECAFEKSTVHDDNRGSYGGSNYANYEDKAIARDFGSKYKSDKRRLIAIMENIIKNKGEFIP